MKYLITESSRFKSLKMIRDIQEIIEERSADGYITLYPEFGSSPTIGDDSVESHQVEAVYMDKVAIRVYDDEGMDLEKEYFLPYEELEFDVLENILDIIEEDNLNI